MNRRVWFAMALLPFLAIAAAQVTAQGNILESILEPFYGLDLASTYENYSSIIDFFLFLIIFIGVAKVTIGKHFAGKGGKAIVVGIGIVLSFSLAIMEGVMGFNLKAFGPIAAAIFILLVAAVLFIAIRHTGISRTGALSISFIITYFSIASVSPGILDWIKKSMPFVNAALAIALIVAIWQLIRTVWPSSEKALARVEETVRKPVESAKNLFPTISALKEEHHLIKSRLMKVTKKEIKESEEIIADLKEMHKIINEYGNLPVGRSLIAKKLDDIRPKEHYSEKLLQYLKGLDKKLESFDIEEFHKLVSQYRKLSKKGKALLKKEILEQREKIKCEERIKAFEKVVEKYQRDIIYAISQAVANLNANKAKHAKDWLSEAIKIEEFIEKEFRRMKKLEKEMLALTKHEIKLSKKITKK